MNSRRNERHDEGSDRGTGQTRRAAVFNLKGMDCADCAENIAKSVERLPGVGDASVNFVASRLRVNFDDDSARDADVIERVNDLGYQATAYRSDLEPTADDRRIFRFVMHRERATTALAAALLAGGATVALTTSPGWLWRLILAIAIAAGGYPIARQGVRGIRSSRTLDINVLMSVAVLGAMAVDQWFEAAIVVVLFSIGETLEKYGLDRARGSIRSLLSRAPAKARIIHDGHEHVIGATEVIAGNHIAVRPGERFPADGRVISGSTAVDEGPVTGESRPVPKTAGNHVFAGTVNQSGFVEIIAERPGTDTAISRIISMVEEAQTRRAPMQRFIDRFARVYTPVIVAVAVFVALLPPLAFEQSFDEWLLRALVLLVIACPCALVISTPVAIAAALASAHRNGILVKGGAFLETLGKLQTIAFDKTGTLTRGSPAVSEVVAYGGPGKSDLIRYAAALESRSEHPVARAIRRAAVSTVADAPLPELADLEISAGLGISARIGNDRFALGSLRYAVGLGIDIRPGVDDTERFEILGLTPVILARNNQLIGLIGVADEPREDAAPALRALREHGVRRLVMLSGDRQATAEATASNLAITDVRAELLPEGKVVQIRALKNSSGPLAMVGDGVNDAPALAAADVGIAMGAAGADAAIETADVALMGDHLCRLPDLVSLGAKTVRTVRLNVALALASKAVIVVIAVAGYGSLSMAVLADLGATLAVTFISLGLLRHRWLKDDDPHFHPQSLSVHASSAH